jgi:hypothetical protein
MPPMSSQLLAQARQISAHPAHTLGQKDEPLSMKSAAVRHISAQSPISVKWPGRSCVAPAIDDALLQRSGLAGSWHARWCAAQN